MAAADLPSASSRLRYLFNHRVSNIVFGLLVIGGCVAAFLAPPFTGLDTLPALAVVLLSLGVLLEDFAVGWTLNRMPAVDRNLLRIGVFEVLMVDDVPPGVAISEAVHLAHELSTDESPRFVNGLLARVAERRPTLTG